MTAMLILLGVSYAMAGSPEVAVSVTCEDSFTESLVKGYIQRELRALGDVTIVEEKEEPHVELSLACYKTKDDYIVASVMKVQHIWSENINPKTGKYTYVIGRAEHYLVKKRGNELKQLCSEIVTELDATYIESIRSSKKSKLNN